MKISVMGAGAVGCYFGARLHQASHAVTLVGRQATVESVNSAGLRVQMQGFDGRLPLPATTDPAAIAEAELVLVCLKSGDTEAAGHAMRPFLSSGSTVICLQNGVDNAERLSRVLECAVVPAAVYVAVTMAGPGHVVHHGRGELVIGPSPGSEAAAHAFRQAGIGVEVTAAVMNALWEKLAANCAYNALSALTQLPYGELVRRVGIEATMREAVAECAAVAAAAGFALKPDIWSDVLALSQSMAGQRSSTAQDLARGRRTEIDFINGHVVREGERLGIAVPVNRVLHALVAIRQDQVVATMPGSKVAAGYEPG